MPVRKSPNIVASNRNMEVPYKDILLTYRNEVKPLIARIESERSVIPDDVVFDTATTFENIALSENLSLDEEKKSKYINVARQAMQHCLSVCYHQLIAVRLRRVKNFQNNAAPSFLLTIEKGKGINDINAGLAEFEKHYQQCDTSEQVSREREVEDLPHYSAAYEALKIPYEIVRQYEPHIIINNTATPRKLSLWKEMIIAVIQCVFWGLIFEIVIELVKKIINWV